MFNDLIDLIFPSGSPFVDSIQTWIDSLVQSNTLTSVDLGTSMIPWDNILSTVILCTFIVCLFKFMRSVFCKVM